MRVCWTGTFVPEFERNKRLREYLQLIPATVTVVREDLWPEDRVSAFTSARLTTVLRMLIVYPKLLFKLLRAPTPDVYLVSYPGWFDVPIVRLVAGLKRKPIVFDVFISLFDTAVSDRQLVGEMSLPGKLARLVDGISIRLSNRLIADCPEHAEFLADLGNVDLDRFGVVYLGADERKFKPRDVAEMKENLVVFYGTYVPLQGVEWIVRAAKILESSGVGFRFIGDGQTRHEVEEIASELQVGNVEFIGLMPQGDLLAEIGAASLVLGIFGTTPKANRVIPHKVFEALACGRPVLTGASDAVVGVFPAEEVAVCLPGNEIAIAEAISKLLTDSGKLRSIARRARQRFESDFSARPQGARLDRELRVALSTRSRSFVRW